VNACHIPSGRFVARMVLWELFAKKSVSLVFHFCYPLIGDALLWSMVTCLLIGANVNTRGHMPNSYESYNSGAEGADRFTVAFHHATASDAVLVRAKQLLGRLVRRNPLIMHGAMTIEGRHRHHHQGNRYHVSLRIHMPGGEVYVSHDPELNHAHEDIYVALRDACDAAHRQLKGFTKRRVQGEGIRHQRARFEGNPRNLE
jgi:hypothetical protein